MTRRWRFALSLYVPFIMRMVGRSIFSVNRDFFRNLVPYKVRHDLRLHTRESRWMSSPRRSVTFVRSAPKRVDEPRSAPYLVPVSYQWGARTLSW